MKRAIFTICAENFLVSAKQMIESIKAHCTIDVDFYVIVADKVNPASAYAKSDHVIEFDDFYGKNFFHQKMRYNITEYCTFLKPYSFTKLFEVYEQVLYLDPDIEFYNDAALIFEMFQKNQHEILITPHFLKCTLSDKPYSETNHLFEGIYNFGFVGLLKSNDTEKLLKWWENRLYLYCYGDKPTNLHTDQKWGDYFPALFPKITRVVTHEGMNVAHWNLHERTVTQDDGLYKVNNDFPLIFFHYSGFDYHGTGLVRRGGVDVEALQEDVSNLANDYRNKLKRQLFDSQLKCKYDWNYDGDGNLISHFQRRILREIDFSEFDCVRDYFNFWKKNGLVDRKATSYIGYSRSTEKHLGTKLALVNILLRAAKRMLGVSGYARLIKLFGYLSLIENHKGIIK